MSSIQNNSSLIYTDCNLITDSPVSITNAVTSTTSQVAQNVLEPSSASVYRSPETEVQGFSVEVTSSFKTDYDALQAILNALPIPLARSLDSLKKIEVFQESMNAFKRIRNSTPEVTTTKLHGNVLERFSDYVRCFILSGNIDQVAGVVTSCSIFDGSVPWAERYLEEWVTEAIQQKNLRMLRTVLEHYPIPHSNRLHRLIRVAFQTNELDVLKTFLEDLKAKGHVLEASIIKAFSGKMDAALSTTSLLLDELQASSLIDLIKKLIEAACNKSTTTAWKNDEELHKRRLALFSNIFERLQAFGLTPKEELDEIFRRFLLQDIVSLEAPESFINVYASVYNVEYLIHEATKAIEDGETQLVLDVFNFLKHLNISRVLQERLISSLNAITDSNKRTEAFMLLVPFFGVNVFEIWLSKDDLDTSLLISMVKAALRRNNKREVLLNTLFERIRGRTLSPEESENFVGCLILDCGEERPSWINLYQRFFPSCLSPIIDYAMRALANQHWWHLEQTLLLLSHLGVLEHQLSSLFTRIEAVGGSPLDLRRRIFPSFQQQEGVCSRVGNRKRKLPQEAS